MKSNKKIAFFGGTGGLGTKVSNFLRKDHRVDSLGSRAVDFNKPYDINNYFYNNPDTEVVIIFNNYNFNSFLHKYKDNDRGEFEEIKKQLNINIEGITKTISTSLKYMRENKFGRIIIASSITADRNVIGTGIYAACKAYCENLVKTIALENASKGITANCIQLGYMDAGLCDKLPDTFKESILKEIPCNRFGSSKEIAQTINFLINTEYINGSTIKLTGGL